MRLARTVARRKMASACAPMITLLRTADPIISLRYTTLMARYPANPRVSAIERTTSAGKLVTYANGQMNTPASTEDRISALRRPILSESQPMA
jgi:hypothetical protein